MKTASSAIAMLLLASPCFASTYYVSPSGAASWPSCTNSGSPCSLSAANANAKPGDTVYLRAGAYSTQIAPANSGSCTPPNFSDSCRIVFSRYPGDAKPVITLTDYAYTATGINLTDRSYVKVDGIGFDTFFFGAYWTNGHYNEIANCEFYGTTNVYRIAIGVGSPVNHNWIHNNIIQGGGNDPCGEGPDVVRIGGAFATYYALNNTVENNLIYHGGHGSLDMYSHHYSVVRNNIMHNEPFHAANSGCSATYGEALYEDTDWNGRWSHRVFQMGCNAVADPAHFDVYALVEGNRLGFAGIPPAPTDANLTLAGRSSIARYNDVFGAMRIGLYFKYIGNLTNGYGSGGTNARVYNNTLYHNGYGFVGGGWNAMWRHNLYGPGTCADCSRGNCDNVIKNNIVYQAQDGDDGGTCATKSNNMCTSAGDGCVVTGNPAFVNGDVTSDPSTIVWSQNLFSAAADSRVTAGYSATPIPNLDLQSTSPAINAGTYLTTAVGAGSSSTSLVVADAFYFQDGTWGSALAKASAGLGGTFQADWIAVGTVGTAVQITAIDYTSNTITLAKAKTWSSGAPIWLYRKSDGTRVLYDSAPDIGAHESGSSASQSCSGMGGTCCTSGQTCSGSFEASTDCASLCCVGGPCDARDAGLARTERGPSSVDRTSPSGEGVPGAERPRVGGDRLASGCGCAVGASSTAGPLVLLLLLSMARRGRGHGFRR